MQVINAQRAVQARLRAPLDSGYLLIAAESATWIGPLLVPSPARRRRIAALRATAIELERRDDIESATVFRAVLRAPGEGGHVLKARGRSGARFDVVVLIRTTDPDHARRLHDDPQVRALVDQVSHGARRVLEVAAGNAARIDDVDHADGRPVLFNYFYADDRDTLLDVWRYTAGWFQEKTSLPNSVLLRPLDGEADDYGIINYASWPTFRTFLPSLIFRPSFRSFVLANFQANDIAAQPIIYTSR